MQSESPSFEANPLILMEANTGGEKWEQRASTPSIIAFQVTLGSLRVELFSRTPSQQPVGQELLYGFISLSL